ncbi:MAG TPA: T9SS type A sorting domain-containing protein [bacterium]|nr:T9SS type A sorting domain-containing protein [bacterium]
MLAFIKNRLFISLAALAAVLLLLGPGGKTTAAQPDAADYYASSLEREIRSGAKSTAALVVAHHPRLWAHGESEWNPLLEGTLAWRIVHGATVNIKGPDNDQSKAEFFYVSGVADDPACFGRADGSTFGRRFLWTILSAHARRYGWEKSLPSSLEPYSTMTYGPVHSADEFYADARAKLLGLAKISLYYEWAYWICIYGSVGYDWLLPMKYSNGEAVLSAQDRTTLQNLLLDNAEHVRKEAGGKGNPFIDSELSAYVYFMVGLALYEPSRLGDAAYAAVNEKAKGYLDDFDTWWVGRILPVLNLQGGDGGWHAGFGSMTEYLEPYYTYGSVVPWQIAPLLFAHYTATGETIERSLFSTGILRNSVEFQNYMILPDGYYYPPYPDAGSRMPWVAPMRLYARRRFSADAEQRRIGELGAWLRAVASPTFFVNAGSWDFFDQLMFEDKWVNPRPPQELGYPLTRWFRQLGWVFMRSGFTAVDDIAALFVSQPFRWSALDQKSQNSFTLDYKGKLIEGYQNVVLVDGEKQRTVSSFPALSLGTDPFTAGGTYDIGPGIVRFIDGGHFDLMVGDATNAYNAAKVKRAVRTVVHLEDTHTFLIYDRVVTKASSSRCDWTLDPAGQPEAISPELLRFGNGGANVWLRRLWPAEGTVISATADLYQFRNAGGAVEQQFLHVLQPCDAGLGADSPAVMPARAYLINEGEKIGAALGDWQIMFQDTSVFVIAGPAGVRESTLELPADFDLEQNYPNPFNDRTRIAFTLSRAVQMELAVYDLRGRRQVTLAGGRMESGRHQVSWNGMDASGLPLCSGVYFYSLSSGKRRLTRKLLLLE